MAYEMVMPYHLHMPSYFLETFTEYPYIGLILGQFENLGSAEISAEPIFLPFHAELKWWEV